MRVAIWGFAAASVMLGVGCTLSCPVQAAAPPTIAPTTTSAHEEHARSHNDTTVARHVYRLDFIITSLNGPGQKFSMNLEEGRTGEINSGSNIPLVPNGSARMDVGTKIKASYAVVGNDLVIDGVTEMSSSDDPNGIHKLVAMGQAVASEGKPAFLASIDDTHAKTHYELAVSATKLR